MIPYFGEDAKLSVPAACSSSAQKSEPRVDTARTARIEDLSVETILLISFTCDSVCDAWARGGCGAGAPRATG